MIKIIVMQSGKTVPGEREAGGIIPATGHTPDFCPGDFHRASFPSWQK
jgi:hypothetical protein